MNSIFLYNLFLSLHIISVIAWMAGLLYLPRLFVYHWSKEVGSESSETFKLMELRLLKIITVSYTHLTLPTKASV